MPHTQSDIPYTHTHQAYRFCLCLFICFFSFCNVFFLQKTDFISNILILYQHKSLKGETEIKFKNVDFLKSFLPIALKWI